MFKNKRFSASSETKERVNTTESAKGLILLKVPKYISNLWNKFDPDVNVAKLMILEQNGEKKICMNLETIVQTTDDNEFKSTNTASTTVIAATPLKIMTAYDTASTSIQLDRMVNNLKPFIHDIRREAMKKETDVEIPNRFVLNLFDKSKQTIQVFSSTTGRNVAKKWKMEGVVNHRFGSQLFSKDIEKYLKMKRHNFFHSPIQRKSIMLNDVITTNRTFDMRPTIKFTEQISYKDSGNGMLMY